MDHWRDAFGKVRLNHSWSSSFARIAARMPCSRSARPSSSSFSPRKKLFQLGGFSKGRPWTRSGIIPASFAIGTSSSELQASVAWYMRCVAIDLITSFASATRSL